MDNEPYILLIEDDVSVRAVAERILKRLGYHCSVARNGAEGIENFHNESDMIDLVFTDVILPDMTGLEVRDEILQTKPDLKFLFSSGYTDERVKREFFLDNNFNFIEKPYSSVDLFKAIETILSNS